MLRATVPAARVIEYRSFGQIINRVAKSADFGHILGKNFGKVGRTPPPNVSVSTPTPPRGSDTGEDVR